MHKDILFSGNDEHTDENKQRKLKMYEELISSMYQNIHNMITSLETNDNFQKYGISDK